MNITFYTYAFSKLGIIFYYDIKINETLTIILTSSYLSFKDLKLFILSISFMLIIIPH